jgi:hypothetical protein
VASRFAVGPVILRTGWPVGSMNVNGPVILYTCNSLIIFVPISYFKLSFSASHEHYGKESNLMIAIVYI